jgi:AAA15 family ATPase/GTPase
VSDHFIREIEIRNYKLFHDFKAEGFGRVNLIGGKNNVGKTAFMEACYLSQSSDTVDLFGRLLEIRTHRDLINVLLSSGNRESYLRTLIHDNLGIEIKLVRESHEEPYERKDGQGNVIHQDMKWWSDGLVKIELAELLNIYTKFTKLDVEPPFYHEGEEISPSYPDRYSYSDLVNKLDANFDSTRKKFSLHYISPYSNSNQELEEIIGQSKLLNKYDQLNTFLYNTFGVLSIDIIKNKPMLKTENEYINLSQFGQGIKSFINYIGSLSLLENTQIFIDEIENGIHYTNFDKLWEIILTISKEQNVQVFATTHSKEMIESYARVAKKLEDDDIRFIELGRDKQDRIQSIVLDRKSLEFELNQNHEVRGW